MVRLIGRIGDGEWAGMVGYGRRWAVETASLTFKRMLIAPQQYEERITTT
ncbi:MAG: hypothetical protein QXK12_08365 [Candidatus Nezhaarchaeales archaeon]